MSLEDTIDPVVINGKVFERADVPKTVRIVSNLLRAAHDKPPEQKISAARFLLAAETSGAAVLHGDMHNYCMKLLNK